MSESYYDQNPESIQEYLEENKDTLPQQIFTRVVLFIPKFIGWLYQGVWNFFWRWLRP